MKQKTNNIKVVITSIKPKTIKHIKIAIKILLPLIILVSNILKFQKLTIIPWRNDTHSVYQPITNFRLSAL